jgi:tetratricopeptide (TPR) repeat protein
MGTVSPGPQQQLMPNRLMAEPEAGEAQGASVAPGDARVPDCDIELFKRGASELETGNLVSAVALLERAIAINPDVAVYHAQLGRARSLLRQFDDAVAALRRAVTLDPRSAEHHFQLGLALSKNGDAQSAIVALDRALALNPGHAAAHHHLGRSLQKSGDVSNAIANYERALFFDPGHAAAHNDLGSAFMQMGAIKAAVACFRRTIELAPGLPEAHFNLGRALADCGEVFAAIDEFRKLVALEPAPGNWAELGNALAAYGGDDESVEICLWLARDRAGLKRLSADLYHEFLHLPLMDEPSFIRAIKALLVRAWVERCRADPSANRE